MALAIVTLAANGKPAPAADLDWSQTVGPLLFYDTAGNWTPAQIPTDGDNVTFSIDVAGLPIIIGALSNGNNVNVIDNDWTFTGGGGATLDTEGLVTIDDPFGTTIANGTNLTVNAAVNWNNAGSIGTGVVDGDGSLLQSRRIDLGFDGTGRLDVSGGAVARTLRQGTSIGDMVIAFALGSDGKVAVHGTDVTDSLLDVDDNLIVGEAGLGQLNIGRDLNDNEVGTGALQVDLNLVIANAAGNVADNKVVVSGAGATVNVGGNLEAGRAGKGTFEARNGATITIGNDLDVGLIGGGDGTVLIDGPGTTVNAAGLFVGNAAAPGRPAPSPSATAPRQPSRAPPTA